MYLEKQMENMKRQRGKVGRCISYQYVLGLVSLYYFVVPTKHRCMTIIFIIVYDLHRKLY